MYRVNVGPGTCLDVLMMDKNLVCKYLTLRDGLVRFTELSG